jgi:hypothetical protein
VYAKEKERTAVIRRTHSSFSIQRSLRDGFRLGLLALIVLLVLFVGLLKPAAKEKVVPTARAQGATSSPSAEIASIWAPFWKLGGGFESTLLFNNIEPRSIILQPLVYTATGELLPANPISLEKLESRQISLRDIIKVQTGEGQIGFSFVGKAMEIVAQIVVANNNLHVSFNHVLMAAMGKNRPV